MVAVTFFAALGCGMAAVALGYYGERITAASAEVQRLTSHVPINHPTQAPPVTREVDLPVFDSAIFTSEFHAIAQDAGLATDELVYVLENSAAQPYQRYRITMEVKSAYPGLRKFVAALNSAQPHVTLDTLRCRRESASTEQLVCQLAFSAFFRKAPHG